MVSARWVRCMKQKRFCQGCRRAEFCLMMCYTQL
uniref:Uncharacterized protein n=1 Tax=Arundo donax TaxID=35708 RepID=A0A0A9H033_ARUDO